MRRRGFSFAEPSFGLHPCRVVLNLRLVEEETVSSSWLSLSLIPWLGSSG